MDDAKRIHVWIVIFCISVLLTSSEGQSGENPWSDDDEDGDDDECHGVRIVYNEVAGQLTSPNYPNPYPNDADCQWRLEASPGDYVAITFDDLDIEHEDDCQYDNIMIYDGPDDTFDLIGTFCGDTPPGPIVSTYRHLYLKFHSDTSDNGRGFSLIYEVDDTARNGDFSEEQSSEEEPELNEPDNQDCRHHLSGSVGEMSSPNYPDSYPDNADCVYIISVNRGERIQLSFLDFDTEEYGCSFDYVVVKDGNSEGADTLGTYCGDEIPEPITSSRNSLYLHFVSDGSDNRRGFFFEFEAQAIRGNGQQLAKQLVFTESPQNLVVNISQSVTQRCAANHDDVDIAWFKDGAFLSQGANDGIYILEDGHLFIIPEIEEQHLARYTCQIQTSNGIVIETTATLHTADSQGPVDVFEVVPTDATINEEDDYVFNCKVLTTSDASIIWTKDNQPIQFDHRIFQIQGNLFVSMALLSHSGTYTCIAMGTNGDRLDSASAQLTIIPKRTTEEICGTVTIGNTTEDGDELQPEDGFRIVGGKAASKGSAPWMARLWRIHDRTHFCGGSILNDYWIVTAAHCILKIERPPENFIQVRLGDYDDLRPDEGERLYDIAQVVEHPQYSDFDQDIALVKLVSKIEFNDYIRPICLPSTDLAMEMLRRRQVGRVLGWGEVLEGGNFPRYLNEVNVPVQRKADCVEAAKPYEMTSNMFCAGYRRALTGDACRGDSGGPFVERRNNKWYLVGIVSWGEGCARQDKFGFYTKVYKFYPWIEALLSQ